MTAPQPSSSWPPPGQPADWPGRPRIDVPGLEQPAHYCHAVATLDEPGHRQLLVIASEDGTLPTLDQLTALADGLDELHGDDAPVGSRAWLRDQLAKHRDELARVGRHESTWQRRAEMAEAAIRDRSAVDEDGRERERLSLELTRTREAHTAQAARAAQLHREREEAVADADRYANALTTLEQERDEARAMVLQLGPPATKLREEVEGLRAERDELRDALVDLLRQLARRAVGELDAKREAATQRRRARSAVTGAAGALTTAAAAALTWRHRR